MTSEQYPLVELDNFADNLHKYFRKDEERIREKIKQMLETAPYRYDMLVGKITVKGIKLAGLRHMKVGVQGYRSGAVILYRICEECLENEYYKESRVKCQFCKDNEGKKIVLFDTYPRGYGY